MLSVVKAPGPAPRHCQVRRRRLWALKSPAATLSRPAQLGADIPVELRTVRVGDRDFVLLLPDAEAVMDMYIARGQADRDPFWCEPWPSALAMAEELLLRPDLVAGQRVAELGCGLGLAGLAAAVAGAAHVVLLDREPLALQCALLNAQLNGLLVGEPPPAPGWAATAAAPPAAAPAQHAKAGGSRSSSSSSSSSSAALLREAAAAARHLPAEVQQLLADRQASHAAASASSSGSSSSSTHTAASSRSSSGRSRSGRSSINISNGSHSVGGTAAAAAGVVSASVFDWSEPVTLPPSGVLLACDVLYETFSVQPVAAVAPRLLERREGSRLLLADPPNRARHNRECFLDLLTEEERTAEFVVEESEEKLVRVWEGSPGSSSPGSSSSSSSGSDGRASWREVPIALMVLRRAASCDTVGVKLGW